MTTETMKLALEALKFGLHVGFDESSESQIKKGGKAFDQHSKAITALRTAIEQAEKQEPVGVVATDTSNPHVYYGAHYVGQRPDAKIVMLFKNLPLGTPVYTTPPAAQPNNEKVDCPRCGHCCPQRQPQYNKTEMNCFVQNLYDQKMREGKRGHYETMFHVVHRAIEAALGTTGEKK